MEAAVKVFYERGYSDATVQDVADELGILKGSLYHYIKTKEDLLFRVFQEVHQDVDKILEEVSGLEGLTPLERLAEYVRRQMRYNLAHLPRISIYYDDMDKLGPERTDFVRERRRESGQFVTRLIEEAQERGEADATVDAQVLSNCLFSVIVWTYRWYHPRKKAQGEELVEACTKFVLHGVVGSGGSGQANAANGSGTAAPRSRAKSGGRSKS